MRKESRTLHAKAVDSLVLAVDHFNRAWDRGRTEAVLILLDRSFELLLKAIIVHRAGGSAIREPGKEGMTLGFDPCLRKCLSDAKLKCLRQGRTSADSYKGPAASNGPSPLKEAKVTSVCESPNAESPLSTRTPARVRT